MNRLFGLFLITIVNFQFSAFATDTKSLIEDSKVSFEDFIKIQGAYDRETTYYYPTSGGIKSAVYAPMNTFILLFSTSDK